METVTLQEQLNKFDRMKATGQTKAAILELDMAINLCPTQLLPQLIHERKLLERSLMKWHEKLWAAIKQGA